MPKPLLNLCDIGIVGESVRCRCGPQRMHTEVVDLGAPPGCLNVRMSFIVLRKGIFFEAL